MIKFDIIYPGDDRPFLPIVLCGFSRTVLKVIGVESSVFA